jgi:hypothetical protein
VGCTTLPPKKGGLTNSLSAFCEKRRAKRGESLASEAFMPYPTCRHRRDDGTFCNSPALRNKQHCYYHHRDLQRQIQIAHALRRSIICDWELPSLETLDDVQAALRRIWREIWADRLDLDRAGVMLFTLQEVSSYLRHTEI